MSTALGVAASPAPSRYRHEIDGLRVLPVLAVIANHLNPDILPSGFLGVDIFFTLSGFVVTFALSRKHHTSAKAYFIDFYARRVKRLFPVLIACIAVTSLLGCLFIYNPEESLWTGVFALFGVSNLYLLQQSIDYFGGSAELNLFTHTWSLGVEEQFYLVFPALLYLCGFSGKQRPGGTRNVLVSIAVLSLLSLGLYVSLANTGEATAYFLTPARFWELGAGCLMFPIARRFPNALSRYRNAIAALLVIALTSLFFLPIELQTWSRIAAVAIVSLAMLFLDARGAAGRSLSHPWLTYIGRLSYSLYLWHWSVIVLSRWTVGISKWTLVIQLPLIFALSAISYHKIETPLRHAQWAKSSLKTIGYGVALVLSTTLFLFFLNSAPARAIYAGTVYPRATRYPFTLSPSYKPCQDGRTASEDFSDCSYIDRESAPEPLRTFYFTGDSHTLALRPLVSQLIENDRFDRLVMLVKTGCFFSETLERSGKGGRACRDSNTAFISKVLEDGKPGDVVIVSSRSKPYFLEPNYSEDLKLSRNGGYTLRQQKERLSKTEVLTQYSAELPKIADKLAERGISLVVFAPLPDWKHLPHECQTEWFRPLALQPETCRLDPAVEAEYRMPIIKAFQQAESESAALHIYDPFLNFCNAENCAPFSAEGTPLFADDDHLNAYGSESLYDDFIEFLDQRNLGYVINEP